MHPKNPVGLTQPSTSASPLPLYLCAFLMVGLSLSLLGPALPQLRARTGSDIGAIGLLFVGQSIGYVCGSVIGGRLYDRFDGHRVFAGSLFALAGGLLLLGIVESLELLILATAVLGFGAASTDLGANVQLMWRLGAGVGRAMNLLHLCFGLGALAAPLFVYLGLKTLTLSAPVVCVALAAWALTIPAPTPVTEDGSGAVPRNSRVALAVSASFFVLYVGLEVGFSGWLYTYAEEIEFTELAATWLTTVFWIGFTFGRLLSSVFAGRFTPKAIMRTATALTIGAALLFLVGNGNVATVWIGTALMGLATAPQFPVMFTFLERRISMTGRATSWFVAGAGLGVMITPWLIGQWFSRSGVAALPRAIVLLGFLTFGAFVAAGRVLGEPRGSATINSSATPDRSQELHSEHQ